MKEDARFSDSNKNDICIGKNYNKHTQTHKHTYIKIILVVIFENRNEIERKINRLV